MKLKVQGKVHAVGEVKSFGTNGFTKRELVVDITEAGSKYQNFALFEFVKERCAKLDGLRKGDAVGVEFFLDAREWNGRWFGSCRGWDAYPAVEAQGTQGGGSGSAQGGAQGGAAAQGELAFDSASTEAENEFLPF